MAAAHCAAPRPPRHSTRPNVVLVACDSFVSSRGSARLFTFTPSLWPSSGCDDGCARCYPPSHSAAFGPSPRTRRNRRPTEQSSAALPTAHGDELQAPSGSPQLLSSALLSRAAARCLPFVEQFFLTICNMISTFRALLSGDFKEEAIAPFFYFLFLFLTLAPLPVFCLLL